ncbi:hypothetical protein CANARDRAFT_25953 [[Candida] arabinofermentans NRRL YB-2248]|uniref:Condensin complex subunit 2 n=1 Tax=[Candida] arabinofermentans NRRL YB-2248 TaxID=983967 RepID=A0A1E4T7J2_9ASCO|nr:hypothetical protein CANARDRAFT_25953 [[Candida] arabinofermentans NRRL YB-2248]
MSVNSRASQQVSAEAHAEYDAWIRLATDNKINATNTWSAGLIDYFHDLSIFREGDSINFQKASATLDGCIKIYASRIDSAATDTGRLLSGLSARGEKTNIDNEDENEEEEEDGEDDDDDESNKTTAKKTSKSRPKAIRTLAKGFETVRVKEVDKELYVDPIFKKALTDFDEGGAKSLLTNMLKMNADGRVVFETRDTSTDSSNIDDNESPRDEESEINTSKNENEAQPTLDISKLGRFMTMTITTDELKVCPSLEQLEGVVNNGESTASLLEQIEQIDTSSALVFHANDDFDFGGDDYEDDNNDENLDDKQNAEESRANRTQYSLFLDGVEDPEQSGPNMTLTRLFDESFVTGIADEYDEEGGREIADYFDVMSKQNWRGPEHWKINLAKKVLQSNSKVDDGFNTGETKEGSNAKPSIDSNELSIPKKNRFIIDFIDDGNDITEDELFQPAKLENRILMPEKDRGVHPTSNTLPEDLQFTTKRLVYLNIKPEQKIKSILTKRKRNLIQGSRSEDDNNIVADADFFAESYKDQERAHSSALDDDFVIDNFENPNYGHDDDDDDDDDDYNNNDYQSSQLGSQQDNIFSQTGKKKSGSLNYARVAKRVNVKLLKDNLWDELETVTLSNKRPLSDLDNEDKENQENQANWNSSSNEEPEKGKEDAKEIKFTELVNGVGQKYSKEMKAELSTSFCFICMLHLANEHGFSIEGNGDYSDLIIKR